MPRAVFARRFEFSRIPPKRTRHWRICFFLSVIPNKPCGNSSVGSRRIPRIPTRLGYATLLYTLQRSDAAREQVEAALSIEPDSAEAHHIRENILEQSGRLSESLEEYSKAVILRPEASRAQLDLGAVLLQTGDKAAALPHLTLASKGDDPNVRRLALEMLKLNFQK